MGAWLPLTPGYLGCSLLEDKEQLPDLGINPQSVINLDNSYVLFDSFKHAWKSAHYQNLLKSPLIPSAGLYQYILVLPSFVFPRPTALCGQELLGSFSAHKFKPVLAS